MACAKKESVVSDAASIETGVEVSVAEMQDIAEKVEEASAEIVESTEEATEDPELYIPEGIDMESTLSGEEWVASFVGKVNEPVVVIFSDDTGRKEVVQANGEITINPDEDKVGVYWPETGMKTIPYAISITETNRFENYEINNLDAERLRSVPVRPASIMVTGEGAEDWVIEFTILVQ